MKVTVYTKQIVKEVVEVPDEFAILLDDDWVNRHPYEVIKMQSKLELTIWPLVSKNTRTILGIYDEKDKTALMEED